MVRGNGSRRKRRLSAEDIDGFIEDADDEKVRRFWQTIKEEKLRGKVLRNSGSRRKKFLSIPLYYNTIAMIFILTTLSFSTWFVLKYTSVELPIDIDITQPMLVVIFAFSAIMFHRYVSDKEEIVGMLDEVAGYSIQNESVFENIGSALIVVDATGNVTKINHKAADILEVSSNDLVGKSCQCMSMDQRLADMLLQTLRSGYPTVNHEIEWSSSKGRQYSLQVTTSLLQNRRGHTIGAVEVISDVTEIHDLQEKLKLNEHLASIGELSAKLGHEVGNSLGGIKLFADNLMEELSPGDHRKEYAAEILSEVERLQSKVSKLKSYSKPVSLDLRRSDVNGIVDEAIIFIKDKLQGNDISVERNLSEDLPEIMIDPDQVRSAFLNIMINAVQSMAQGGELTVSTQRHNGSVELLVGDTGEGIPEEIRSKIFNPFFTTKKVLGTGLGLSIVYKTIHAHGGTVTFESEVGSGTTFTIALPVEMAESDPYAHSLLPAEAHC